MTDSSEYDSGAPGRRASRRPVRWTEDLALVQRLFEEYRTWVADHRDPAPSSQDRVRAGLELLDSLVADLPRAYGPPHGDILLWFEGENVVACGALRELEPGIGELRRVHVQPEYRGPEFGRPFVRALIDRARALGYTTVRAETLPTMRAAIEFHQELGFHRIPPYWPHPAAGVLFFERPVDLPGERHPPSERRRPKDG